MAHDTLAKKIKKKPIFNWSLINVHEKYETYKWLLIFKDYKTWKVLKNWSIYCLQ